MNEQSNAVPAGGWVILSKLRSDLNIEVVHNNLEIASALRTWGLMRIMRNETTLGDIQVTCVKPEVDGQGRLSLTGNSVHTFEITMLILRELTAILLEFLDQNKLEFFLGGKRVEAGRTLVTRPPGVTLN